MKTAEKIPASRKSPNKHDLLTLLYAIPEPIRQRVRLDRHEHWIEKYRDVFINARYRYENGAPKGYDDILIEVLDELIDDVVDWYREQKCQDLFIVCHGMTPADFQPKPGEEPEPS